MHYTAAVLLLTLANPQGIFGQSLEMDGYDMFGTPGPSGMYIVVMHAGEFMDTKKVILLK